MMEEEKREETETNEIQTDEETNIQNNIKEETVTIANRRMIILTAMNPMKTVHPFNDILTTVTAKSTTRGDVKTISIETNVETIIDIPPKRRSATAGVDFKFSFSLEYSLILFFNFVSFTICSLIVSLSSKTFILDFFKAS